MAVKFKNNATGTLKTGIDDLETDIELTTGHGDRFPAVTVPNYFYATFEDVSGNKEIVKVTQRTGGQDTMVIERAQESTSALSWLALDVFELRLTAGVIEDISDDTDTNTVDIATNAAAIAAMGTIVSQDSDDVDITGGSAELDNVADDKPMVARDHGTPAEGEVGNVCYGTGSPPVANTVPIGTLFIKYVA